MDCFENPREYNLRISLEIIRRNPNIRSLERIFVEDSLKEIDKANFVSII